MMLATSIPDTLRAASPLRKAVLSGLVMALLIPLEIQFRNFGTPLIEHAVATRQFYGFLSGPLHWLFVLAVLLFLLLQLVVDRSLRLPLAKWMGISAIAQGIVFTLAAGSLPLLAHGMILGYCLASGLKAPEQRVRFGIWIGVTFLASSYLTEVLIRSTALHAWLDYPFRSGDFWRPSVLDAFVFGATPILVASEWIEAQRSGLISR